MSYLETAGFCYRDNMEIISGIYYIVNKVNGHKYIGSSTDIKNRFGKHKSMLRGGYHHNPHLQSAWDKYDEENFDFKVIAYTDPDKAVVLEEHILKNYFDRFEYNIAESATAPMLGRDHAEETKQKMSEINSGENNPFYGKNHSEECRQKISESLTGEKHPLYGRHRSEETKRKISESNSGEKHYRWIDIPEEAIIEMKSLNEQGYSYRQIADIFGFSINTVYKRINAYDLQNN
jgi:group I intron endonuclease